MPLRVILGYIHELDNNWWKVAELIVGLICSALSIFIVLSPFPTYRKLKADSNITSVPVVCILLNSLFWTSYGVYIVDVTVAFPNFFGIVMGILYVFMYWRKKRSRRFYILLGASMGIYFVALICVFLFFYGTEARASVFGICCNVVTIVMFSSPLVTIYEVVTKKDSSSIPFLISIANFLATISWFSYGIMKANMYMITPNGIGLILSSVSLFVKMYYRPNKKKRVYIPKNMMDELEGQIEKEVKNYIISSGEDEKEGEERV